MVGHTHADIDAVFGRLWKYIRHAHVLTPGAYKDKIIEALTTPAWKARVIDLFVVPDYDAFLRPSMGTFSRYCKEEYTQLVFTFEAVGLSPDFPTGCKTTYRAYCKDEVIEIVPNPNPDGQYEYIPLTAKVSTFPKESNSAPEGMYIMQRVPRGQEILASPFLQKSRASLDEVVRGVRKYGANKKATQDWEFWADNIAPQSDNVEDHIKIHPEHFHVPFLHQLFLNDTDVDPRHVQPATTIQSKFDVVYTTDSVKWSRRGEHRPDNDPQNFPRISAVGVGIAPEPRPPSNATTQRQQRTRRPQLDENGQPIVPKRRAKNAEKTVNVARPVKLQMSRQRDSVRVPTSSADLVVASGGDLGGIYQSYWNEEGEDTYVVTGDGGVWGEMDSEDDKHDAFIPPPVVLSTSQHKRIGAKRNMDKCDYGSEDSEVMDSDGSKSSSVSSEDSGSADDLSEDYTHSESESHSEWIVKRTNFNVPHYGNSALYWGRQFKFITNRIPQLDSPYVNAEVMRLVVVGKITSIVYNKNCPKKIPCFQFYDSELTRRPRTDQYFYIPCMYLMSSDQQVRAMELMPVYGIEVGPLGLSLEGRVTSKYFKSTRSYCKGVVKKFYPQRNIYSIHYAFNSLNEDVSEAELLKMLRCD